MSGFSKVPTLFYLFDALVLFNSQFFVKILLSFYVPLHVFKWGQCKPQKVLKLKVNFLGFFKKTTQVSGLIVNFLLPSSYRYMYL